MKAYTISALDAEGEFNAEDLELVAKLSSGVSGQLDLGNHDNKAQLTINNQYDKLRLTLQDKVTGHKLGKATRG